MLPPSEECIVSCAEISKVPKTTIEHCLREVTWESSVSHGDSVAVKPNMCHPFYEPGIVTSKDFLADALDIITRRAGRVYLVESNGLRYSADSAFRSTGFAKIASEFGVECVNLSNERKVK